MSELKIGSRVKVVNTENEDRRGYIVSRSGKLWMVMFDAMYDIGMAQFSSQYLTLIDNKPLPLPG